MLEQVNIIVGLPGSGKSYYLKDKEGFILDDEKDFLSVPNYDDIKHKTMYISHPMLCLEKYQNILVNNIKTKYKDVEINFYCFENKPQRGVFIYQQLLAVDLHGSSNNCLV